jgi:flagellar biosynthesis protein FliR
MSPVIQQLGEQQVAGFFLVLARVSPLFVLAPLFSSPLMPPRVRGIVAVALAVGLAPVVARAEIPVDTFTLAGLIGKELLIGLAFAFVLGALFAALSVAGTFLDTSIGFAFGSVVDPISGNQNAVLAQLYALIGVLIFIAIGGDAWVVQGLARTYDLVPMESFPALGLMTSGVLEAFVAVFVAAIQVAGPVMLALILTDAAFGMVSRVVPQLNVFAVGFGAKVIVGIALLGVTLPFLSGWLGDELERSVADALRMLRVG